MLRITPIGTIYTPFTRPEGMPVQPRGADGVRGTVEIFESYQQGLADLDGFSHIILLYHFHLSDGYDLQVVPFLDDHPRGLFASRAPRRPNPVGLSVVKLWRIEDSLLYVENIDVLNETPLLDIKPFAPQFDSYENIRTGWLDNTRKAVDKERSDSRFR